MWLSAISSSSLSGAAASTPGARGRGIALLGLCLALVFPGWTEARVFLTVEEALDLAFPDCEVERRTVFLTEAQERQALEEAGVELASGVAYPYRATCSGKPGGTAYFDTHRVRTLPETLMIVVDPDGEVRRLEILAFREPTEYIPPEPWYRQFLGEELRDDLRLQGAIRGVTGATLTARATTEAVRRVLAIHRVIEGDGDSAHSAESSESSESSKRFSERKIP